jgi:hypothetical protein
MVKVLAFGLMGCLGGFVVSGWLAVAAKTILASIPLAF